MTDLLARLAQIQNAHGGKIYRDMSMDEKLNMQEEVADLALDALAVMLKVLEPQGATPEECDAARTILRELRGATLGEGPAL